MLEVIKRDGTKEDFTTKRIFEAVYLAATDAGYESEKAFEISDMVTTKVVFKVLHREGDEVTVESIQDDVEKVLMTSKYKDVAKKYIEYRSERDRVREGKGKVFADIEDFLNGGNEEVTKENTNKDSSQIVTHRDLVAGIVSKHIAKFTIPKDILELHEKGALHCHDQDYFLSKGMHNCGVYDFHTMLENGVKLGDVDIESPKSIQTAANVTCQIFSKISGSSYGGQSMHEFDQVMKPYVEKSLVKLRESQQKYNLPEEFVQETIRKEVYDACQTFIYQIQTVTSSNGQAAFSTISLSLSQDPICKMIKEQYLKCHMKGIGKESKTPIFPKVIYFLEDGVNLNKNDPNYAEFQLAMECSSKQMYPDYVMAPNNREMTGGSKNVITPMGCRSFVGKYEENGQEKTSGRFNLGVCTVNIVYAALASKDNLEGFWRELDNLCNKAFDFNQLRIERMKGTKARVSPILWQYGALASLDAENTIDHLFYNGNATCSIGYAGLYETMEILGNTNKDFGMEILQFMKDKTKDFTKSTGIAYGLYGSPFESGCYRMTQALRKTFPEWKFDREFITNSFHLPVFVDVDMIGKFEYESDFWKISSSGNVNNIETPNLTGNLEAAEAMIKYAYGKVNYLIWNQPVDACFDCGFRGEFAAEEDGYHCPKCGNNNPETASCIRRVSGYIHDTLARPANKGKFQEQVQRVKHS